MTIPNYRLIRDEFLRGERTGVFIDDTGHPGVLSDSEYLNPKTKYWVAVIIPHWQMPSIMTFLQDLIQRYKDETGLSEFHFTDIYNGRGKALKFMPLSKRLAYIERFAHIFSDYRLPIITRSLEPDDIPLYKHRYGFKNKMGPFNMTKVDEVCLFLLIADVLSFLNKNQNTIKCPARIFIDEGWKKHGMCMSWPDPHNHLVADGFICFGSSINIHPIQMADFAAFAISKNYWTMNKNKMSPIESTLMMILSRIIPNVRNVNVKAFPLTSNMCGKELYAALHGKTKSRLLSLTAFKLTALFNIILTMASEHAMVFRYLKREIIQKHHKHILLISGRIFYVAFHYIRVISKYHFMKITLLIKNKASNSAVFDYEVEHMNVLCNCMESLTNEEQTGSSKNDCICPFQKPIVASSLSNNIFYNTHTLPFINSIRQISPQLSGGCMPVSSTSQDVASGAYVSGDISPNESYIDDLLRSNPHDTTLNNTKAIILMQKGNYKDANKIFEKLLRTCSSEEKGMVIFNIATSYLFRRLYSKAFPLLCDAIKMFESSGSQLNLATAYNCVGTYYDMTKNHPKAMEYCFKAVEIFNSLKNQDGLADSYNNLGQIYKNSNDVANSEIMHNNALSIYISSSALSGMAISHINLGCLCASKERYPECINHYKEAFKIYSKLGIPYSMGKCLALMGMLSYSLNKDNEAYQYFADAFQYLKSFKPDEDIAVFATTRGMISVSYKKDYHEAIKDFSIAAEYYSDIKDIPRLAVSYLNIGSSYEQLGIKDKAREFFIKGKTACKSSNCNPADIKRLADYIEASC